MASYERQVHPDCIYASNPYHECVYCRRKIAEAKAQSAERGEFTEAETEESVKEDVGTEEHPPEGTGTLDVDLSKLRGRQKKLFELKQKLFEARKANQTAMVAEKKRMEAPPESRAISKEKWKKKVGKLLESKGLDMAKAYMLDTQEAAETKYKKREKDEDRAPFGWDVFNQKTLYNAYKKRTKNVTVDLEEYKRMKEEDPELYRSEASSLQYGKAPKTSQDKIEKMVKELKDRDEKRNTFSRRRKFHDDKDIDSINDRNEHFNKKIERAFGKYTLEIKNNLERGTALPD